MLPVVDFGEEAREDDVDEGASPPRAAPATPAVLMLLRDFLLDDDDDDDEAVGALPLEGLGLLAPMFTVGTRSLAKSWAWRASLARRYLPGRQRVRRRPQAATATAPVAAAAAAAAAAPMRTRGRWQMGKDKKRTNEIEARAARNRTSNEHTCYVCHACPWAQTARPLRNAKQRETMQNNAKRIALAHLATSGAS